MKITFLVVVFLQFVYFANAQFLTKKIETHKLEIGLSTDGSFEFFEDNNYDEFYFFDYIVTPTISYFPTQNIGVGAIFNFSIAGSNFTEIPFQKSIGMFSRLYLPWKINNRHFKKLDFFIEFNFSLANYYFPKNMSVSILTTDPDKLGLPPVFSSMNQKNINIPIGIKYQLTHRLYSELSYQYYYNFHEKGWFYPRIGFNYQLISDKIFKKIKKTISTKSEKNTDFFNTFIVGSSFCYMYLGENELSTGEMFSWSEYTWKFDVAVSISRKIFIGIQALNITIDNSDNEHKNFSMYGIFAQYNLLKYRPERKKRFFIDLSINNGNVCYYGEKDGIYRPNTVYGGIGMGFDIHLKRISKHLFLDISGYYYPLLSKIKKGWSFTQYNIGLNYHFGKRVQEKWH